MVVQTTVPVAPRMERWIPVRGVMITTVPMGMDVRVCALSKQDIPARGRQVPAARFAAMPSLRGAKDAMMMARRVETDVRVPAQSKRDTPAAERRVPAARPAATVSLRAVKDAMMTTQPMAMGVRVRVRWNPGIAARGHLAHAYPLIVAMASYRRGRRATEEGRL